MKSVPVLHIAYAKYNYMLEKKVGLTFYQQPCTVFIHLS